MGHTPHDRTAPRSHGETLREVEADIIRAIRSARITLTRTHAPEWFAGGLSVISLVLAFVLATDADLVANPTFAENFTHAKPGTWGVLLAVPSLIVLLLLPGRRHDLWWPLATMGAWYAAWTLGAALGLSGERSVGTAVPIYSLAVWTSCALSWIYYREGSES